MAFYVPNGSTIEIASATAASVNITALSNASEAVATATNTLSTGDIVVITSGWSRLNGRVVRVKSATGTTFVLEGIDTSDTQRFPPGGGTGAFAKVTTWQQVNQITGLDFSGGDQNFVDFQFLDEDFQRSLPTFKSAIKVKIEAADDPSLPWYGAAQAANDDGNPRAIRINAKNGSKTLFNGIVSLMPIPKLTVNAVATVEVNLSLNSFPTRYAS